MSTEGKSGVTRDVMHTPWRVGRKCVPPTHVYPSDYSVPLTWRLSPVDVVSKYLVSLTSSPVLTRPTPFQSGSSPEFHYTVLPVVWPPIGSDIRSTTQAQCPYRRTTSSQSLFRSLGESVLIPRRDWETKSPLETFILFGSPVSWPKCRNLSSYLLSDLSTLTFVLLGEPLQTGDGRGYYSLPLTYLSSWTHSNGVLCGPDVWFPVCGTVLCKRFSLEGPVGGSSLRSQRDVERGRWERLGFKGNTFKNLDLFPTFSSSFSLHRKCTKC